MFYSSVVKQNRRNEGDCHPGCVRTGTEFIKKILFSLAEHVQVDYFSEQQHNIHRIDVAENLLVRLTRNIFKILCKK